MYKSIVLILLVLFPLVLSGVINSSSTTPAFSYLITANWKTIPTLDNLTTINVNLITFLNSTRINAYALIVKILLPQGILNTTEGNYIEDILPLSSQVQQYNLQFNVTIVNSSLPNELNFPVMFSLITESGDNAFYNTSFTLPYYGTYGFSIILLNSSLIQGLQDVIFRITTQSPIYNAYISSPYFMKNITLSYVNGSKDISVELFVPFQDIPIYHVNIPLTIRFLTPYNLYYVKQFVLQTNVNTSIPTLYANVQSPTNVVYPGYNNLDVSIANKENLPITNLTIITNYNNFMKKLVIPYLSPNSTTNFTLSIYANSNVSLKLYAFFDTPLGFQNVSLGSYYFPLVYPISVMWNNGYINISNRGNVSLNNITVQFGEEIIDIVKLSPEENILYPTTIKPNLVYITFYADNREFSYSQKVYEVPFVRLNVSYQFINVTRSTTGTYTATLILYIQNTGNQYANNIYILIKPNGTGITPPFYVISQILPNETIAMPFTIHVTKNAIFQISMFYYYNNQTYVKNITIPVNYVKLTPGETIMNYIVNYVGKYTLYQIYGIPAIVIAFILIVILISI
ncbi:hypothetical protein [Sulfolobus sp. E11-6]|uniref:hypothetical protein n=1 Tax=Sulfolobus sp. E11-6 TaxID=2663020 RepID=UPI0012979874|nr:hypothetical protein [Sulfolobus sp. E11-6]QGA69089.1 hypothetical protein GFS33_10595 [Sulfolobus sp. E11-6]